VDVRDLSSVDKKKALSIFFGFAGFPIMCGGWFRLANDVLVSMSVLGFITGGGMSDLLRNETWKAAENMEKQKINWLELTDVQRAKLLKQIKAHLLEQVEEAIISKSVMEVLSKQDPV